MWVGRCPIEIQLLKSDHSPPVPQKGLYLGIKERERKTVSGEMSSRKPSGKFR